MATHVGKSLYLTIIGCDGDNVLELKLHTQGAACALYRSITEYHAFYRCETVRNAVKSQFTRDFKETFFSLFNEEESDKKYIFDVRRTCKEVYDHCRRVLYNQGYDPIHMVPFTLERKVSIQLEGDEIENEREFKEKLHKVEHELRCKICMDTDISTVFCPCGHMVSCEVCAEHLEMCPVCRGSIEKVQKAFLPVSVTS
jgi:E3 ubiquitin-protein ligase MYLIP